VGCRIKIVDFTSQTFLEFSATDDTGCFLLIFGIFLTVIYGYYCNFGPDVKIMIMLFYTGKEAENATLSHGVIMCQAIKKYHNATGYKVHNDVLLSDFL